MKFFKEKRSIMICGTILAIALLVRVETGNADATIPNTFSPGTTINSSPMNANFSAVGNQMAAVKQVSRGNWVSIPNTRENNRGIERRFLHIFSQW